MKLWFIWKTEYRNEIINIMTLQLKSQEKTNELLLKLLIIRSEHHSIHEPFNRRNFNSTFILPDITLEDIHRIEELL